jgi:hypothetical protein
MTEFHSLNNVVKNTGESGISKNLFIKKSVENNAFFMRLNAY